MRLSLKSARFKVKKSLTRIEYISLRMIRKFIFTTQFISIFESIIPYYKKNMAEFAPKSIVENYLKYCDGIKLNVRDKDVLEIGVGRTNSTGYQFILKGVRFFFAYEPLLRLNKKLEAKFQYNALLDNPALKEKLIANIDRIQFLRNINDNSVDIIFSNSVLEHVIDLDSLLSECDRILKDDGVMVHIVDYRDHFFKYPYQFLLFSKKIWDYFLNPGDLPRYRISNHLEKLKEYNFTVEIIDKKTDDTEFKKIKNLIHNDFKHINDRLLSVTKAVLLVKKKIKL